MSEKAIYQKKYYQDHKEEKAASRKKYYQDNKEEKAASQKTPNGKYTQYKCGASSRGIEFDLSKEEFAEFWQKPCSYCGGAISTVGIDRINSDIGYVMSNCKSCCSICNRMKFVHSLEEWQDQMFRILKHQGVI